MSREYYLVFLGENETVRNGKVFTRMKSLGEYSSLAPNIHLLTIDKGKGLNLSGIRESLCGEDKTMLLVTKVRDISDAAWTLTKTGSDLLIEKFAEVHG